jgi:type IX secretion system PorP/SprF family membrane protein
MYKNNTLRYFNYKICVLGSIFFIISIHASAQQSFSYTQYMNNLSPLNHAFSLVDKDGSVNMLVRKQWVGIEGAPSTFIFNGNLPLHTIGATAGLVVMNDHLAVEDQTEIDAFFAKSIAVNDDQYLGVSINGGLRRYVANYSTLDPTDQAFKDDIRETKPNVGFGILYYGNNFYIGLSAPKLTFRSLGNASVTDNRFFRNRYYFSGSFTAEISDGIKVKPATLVAYSRGVPIIADVSTSFIFKDNFGMGINYRTNSEVAGLVSFTLGNFRLGYSYQFGTSSTSISGFSNATHEVTLGFHFSKTDPRTAEHFN